MNTRAQTPTLTQTQGNRQANPAPGTNPHNPHTQNPTVALIQLGSPPQETHSQRLKRVQKLIENAQPADLFILPELWGVGYTDYTTYPQAAENPDGPTIQLAKQAARHHKTHIHTGSHIEKDSAGRLYNTATLINPQGETILKYRKIHLFGYHSKEPEILEAGNTLQTAKTPLGTLASTICYDLRFTGLWQQIQTKNIDTIVIPAAWPKKRINHWRTLLKARAIETQAWILGCNATAPTGGGHSAIINPQGETIAEADEKEQILYAQIDPLLPTQTREHFPVRNDSLTPEKYMQI